MATTVFGPEVLDDHPTTAVSVQESIAIPANLTELAARTDKGLEIIKARAEIMETARRAAIRMTSPEDWVLFKDPEGRITGYLQDSGCDRVRDILGIEVFNVSRPERLPQGEGFIYVLQGDGRCKLTGQVLESIEGGRSSTDDFVARQKPYPEGSQLELLVRKAARSNLDGRIVRSLAGLEAVSIDVILEAYKGKGDANSLMSRFRQGRGFGSAAQRQGAKIEDDSGISEKPVCPECGGTTNYKSGTSKSGKPYAFYSCAKYPKCAGSWDAGEWKKELDMRHQDQAAMQGGE